MVQGTNVHGVREIGSTVIECVKRRPSTIKKNSAKNDRSPEILMYFQASGFKTKFYYITATVQPRLYEDYHITFCSAILLSTWTRVAFRLNVTKVFQSLLHYLWEFPFSKFLCISTRCCVHLPLQGFTSNCWHGASLGVY